MARILGIPVIDIDTFEQWSTDIGLSLAFPVAPVLDRVESAIRNLFDYAGALVAERRRTPGDDLISALIAMEADGERLSARELQWIVVNLTFGGHDTTRNQLAYLLRTFCGHPDQWRRVAADPACVAGAIEEGMRLSPAIPATARTVRESSDYDGVRFPPGTLLILRADCANRDPDVFHAPETFDITRENAGKQVTFGGGLHTCLGVYLARTEIAQALPLLARAMPDVRLAGPGQWRPYSNVILGPESMPIGLRRTRTRRPAGDGRQPSAGRSRSGVSLARTRKCRWSRVSRSVIPWSCASTTIEASVSPTWRSRYRAAMTRARETWAGVKGARSYAPEATSSSSASARSTPPRRVMR